MKIGFIGGHSNAVGGAVGCGYREEVVCRELADMCVRYAKENYQGTFLTDGINQHSGAGEESFVINNKLDYFISIHLNSASASANGSEIIVSCKEKTVGIETKILDRLNKEIGYRNRGVKRRQSGGDWVSGYKNVNDYYGIIRQPKNAGISGAILEVCFISNKSDMDKLVANKAKIVKIIVESICDGFGLKRITSQSTTTSPQSPSKPQQNTTGKIYRTVIFSGSYEGAKKKEAEAKAKGFTDAFVVEK